MTWGLPPPPCLTIGSSRRPLFCPSRGVEAAWLREIDACFGRLGGSLERPWSLISPLARGDALTRGIPWLSRLVQSASSCITCCRMMMGGAIASCDPFFSWPVVSPRLHTVARACVWILDHLACSSPVSATTNTSSCSKRVGVAVFRGAFLGSSLFPSSPSRCSHSHHTGFRSHRFLKTGGRRDSRGRVATEGCSGRPVPAGEPCFVDRGAVMA